MALRTSSAQLRESVLSSISPRSRRMIESDLQVEMPGTNPREIAIARRAIAQEALRLANSGQIILKDPEAQAEGAAA
ncbi:flagellar motor switch protein G [compost metagenome]